jgi:hypothetical protein
MADELVFDGHDFNDFARRLNVAVDRYKHEMTPTMAVIGEEVAAAARGIAGQHSAKVAATIKTVPLPGAVAIKAGDAQTPIAVLWELGNKGSKRSARQFRHPVFGDKNVWVEQDKHPYLAPALLATRASRSRRLEQEWERIRREIEGGR